MIQDFRKTQDWTVDDHKAAHDSDLAWLLGEIDSTQAKHKAQSEKQILLVETHRATVHRGYIQPPACKEPLELCLWHWRPFARLQVCRVQGLRLWPLHTIPLNKHGRVRVVSTQR
ncbi:hypothetical protein BDV10DRAFT_167338 [Aspergillus recurvatus]